MAATDEAGTIALKQKTPPPPLKEEFIAIRAVAQANRAVVEAQGVENEEHARVMSRMLERAKKFRNAAEKKELDEFGVQHRAEIREMQRAKRGGVQERDEVLEDVVWQQKEGIVEAMSRDEEVIQMQMQIWGRFCAICRVRDGQWWLHDWRECCYVWADEAKAIREAIEGIRTNRANWERNGPKAPRCTECQQTREDCWFWSVKGSGKRWREGGCHFRGVMMESAAAILALGGKRVEAWERADGRLGGEVGPQVKANVGRLGYYAVERLWRRFGWMGLMNIGEMEIDQVGKEYRSRLLRAGQGNGAEAEKEWQVTVRAG